MSWRIRGGEAKLPSTQRNATQRDATQRDSPIQLGADRTISSANKLTSGSPNTITFPSSRFRNLSLLLLLLLSLSLCFSRSSIPCSCPRPRCRSDSPSKTTSQSHNTLESILPYKKLSAANLRARERKCARTEEGQREGKISCRGARVERILLKQREAGRRGDD